MQKHLQKLKFLILKSAEKNNYSEESAISITQVLQTLLKIAELSVCSNEGTTLVTNNSTVPEGSRRSTGSCQPQPNMLHPLQLRESSSIDVDCNNLRYRRRSSSHRSPMMATCCGDSDPDYYSTRASLICHDSEVEFSENDAEEYYITADEGYEADGEIPEISETTENETEELWSPFTPGSKYRTHIVHKGLCRLVVEILIELSKMCISKPDCWVINLSQLASRLYVIRDQLGGPLFLLQGFMPVLQCNDVRLKGNIVLKNLYYF